jgi:hypothetical protein
MPRLLRVWVRKNDHHKIPSVGQPLRLSPIPHVRPTVFAPFLAREPFHLRVGKQFLTVLRRPQQVNSQPLSGRSSKCAAMRMTWAFVFSAPIGLSRFPIYVFVRRLMRFYVQLIQRAPVAVQPH